MYCYYFILKGYRKNHEQAKCISSFGMMLLPIFALQIMIRYAYPGIFHALLFLTGWCTWTFAEYILHRFWMHDKNSGSAIARTHHHHHTHPTELVVTNFHRAAMMIILAFFVLIAIRLNNYFTFFPGFLFGLEGYFLMHRLLHLKITQRVFKKLVRYHIYHHCKYPNTCFGISVPWWDDLFCTVPKDPNITERIIDFYFKGHDESHNKSLPGSASQARKARCKMDGCPTNCSGKSACMKIRTTAKQSHNN
jgi:hypothetical protein